MCGLAGIIAPASFKEADAFVDLLKISSLRGPHSTGLMVSRKHVTTIYKDAVNSVEFAESFEMSQRTLNPMLMYDDVYMAHCRYATVGEISRRNAHPFKHGNLVMAHNGTAASLKTKGMLGTDSQVLLSNMSSIGIIPALSALGPQDSFAVSVFDTTSKVLYLARNTQRPLAFAVLNYTGTMMYASEPEMLAFVLKRNHLSGKIMLADPWLLFRIDPKNIAEGNYCPWTTEEIPHGEEVINELPEKSTPFVQTST